MLLFALLCTPTSCVRVISTQSDWALEEQLERVPIVKIFVKRVPQGEVQKYGLMTGFPFGDGILGVHHRDDIAEVQIDGQPVKVLARSRTDEPYDDWMFLEKPSSYSSDPIPGGSVEAGTPVWVVGYPMDGIRSLPDTRKRQRMRGSVVDCTNCPRHTIFVLPEHPARDKDHLEGFSGSPTLYLDDSGRLRVCGVCVAWRIQDVTIRVLGIPLPYGRKTLLVIRRIPSATELREGRATR